MPKSRLGRVAIVDFGMGNLFSVQQACQAVGLQPVITTSARELLEADAVILPGVGAFGDAMATLEHLELIDVLRELALSGRPFMGICLGQQLLMTESFEFSHHRGLNLIEGDVVPLKEMRQGGLRLKVPQIGWNRIAAPKAEHWDASCLEGVSQGEFMYFVHSFYVRPRDADVILATTRYGSVEFCSALRRGQLFACQFHPERSGPAGLRIYRNFAAQVRRATVELEHA